MKKAFFLLASAAVALPAPVLADDAGLRRCRAITQSAARLACYDALPLGTALPPGAAARPAPGLPPAPPAAARTPPPAKAAASERFGLEYKAAKPADDLETIATHIPGHFEGWRPNMHIRLANGQVWQVIDDSTRFMSLENPKVVVRRGMLGAFFLDIENDNRSPRVRRIQ